MLASGATQTQSNEHLPTLGSFNPADSTILAETKELGLGASEGDLFDMAGRDDDAEAAIAA